MSGSKNLQSKQNYALKLVFIEFLYRLRFFFNVNLDIRLDNFTNDTVIKIKSVLYPWLYYYKIFMFLYQFL